MNSKLESAQNNFMASIGRISAAFGLNRFITQLYVFLYLNDKPLSLDEIVDALGVSKGNVSVNIRELEKWGAVRNIWVKGSRKDYYQAERDVKKVFLHKIKSAVQKRAGEVSALIDDFKGTLASVDEDLSEADRKAISIYEEKLREIEKMKNTAISVIELFSKMA